MGRIHKFAAERGYKRRNFLEDYAYEPGYYDPDSSSYYENEQEISPDSVPNFFEEAIEPRVEEVRGAWEDLITLSQDPNSNVSDDPGTLSHLMLQCVKLAHLRLMFSSRSHNLFYAQPTKEFQERLDYAESRLAELMEDQKSLQQNHKDFSDTTDQWILNFRQNIALAIGLLENANIEPPNPQVEEVKDILQQLLGR